jgi:hypothetical protein
MYNNTLILLIITCLFISIPAKAFEDQDPKGVSAATEIQLKKVTPSFKTITIEAMGLGVTKELIDTLHSMITDIIKHAKLNVVRIAVHEEPIRPFKVYENLVIVIQVNASRGKAQPYLVRITLQEEGREVTEGETRTFEYDENNWWYFYKAVQDYLSGQLNFRPN